DLGCGTGNYELALSDRGVAAVGVDFAPGMLTRAAAKAPGASFVRADLQRPLPFADHSVAAVLSVYSLQLLDIARVLGEVRRVLVPGGQLLVEVPSSASVRRPPRGVRLSHRAFYWAKRVLVRVGVSLRLAELRDEAA